MATWSLYFGFIFYSFKCIVGHGTNEYEKVMLVFTHPLTILILSLETLHLKMALALLICVHKNHTAC